MSELPPRLIDHDALASRCIPFTRRHLARLEKAGKFPKRINVSPRRYAYVAAEIDAYLQAKIAERDAAVKVGG